MRTTDDTPPPALETFIKNSRCYAGIGSRATPPFLFDLIGNIAATLAGYGLMLRSGGAPGADTAFEAGCDRRSGKKEIYLPWQGFNNHPSPLFDPPEQAETIAAFCHPCWSACTEPARKLHARNCQQVYGQDLKSPVDFVLFWAPEVDGLIQGGTATAVVLARTMKIPTFNLWDKRMQKRWEWLIKNNDEWLD